MNPSTQSHGYVYALGTEGSRLVKIGSTYESVCLRLASLQTGSPHKPLV